ncbi:MAG: protein kinase domain-containing protein [Thermoleophilia bacterium]|jgi:serine/threonine protein kinase
MPETVRLLINRGPIDPALTIRILEQLLKTLEFTHWRGLVYGTIRPETIEITTDEEVMHAGFATQASAGPVNIATDTDATAYLPPEHQAGEPADRRSDLFAMGVVAYEMFTGRLPFPAGGAPEQATPLTIPEATMALLPAHIPPALTRALAKDPEDRFLTAISFLEALQGMSAATDPSVDTDAGVDDTPPKEPALSASDPRADRNSGRRRTWIIGVSALVVVVVIAAATWIILTTGDNKGSAASIPETVNAVAPTGDSNTAATPSTTPLPTAPTTTAAVTSTTSTTILHARYEETELYVLHTGVWKTTTDAAASGGSFRFANSAQCSVTVTFVGTHLAWIAKKSPVYGNAEITLDGKSLGTIDLYSQTTKWQEKVWGTGTLKPGIHTVTIAWTGTKNNASTGTYISVDAFEVTGSLLQSSEP